MEKFLHLLLFLHPFVLPASASCIGVGTGLWDLVLELKSERLLPGSVSLNVNWTIPPSACDVTGQSLVIQQLDNDRCPYKGNEKTTDLQTHHRKHSFTGMQPNTEYNVTLKIHTTSGMFSVSEKIRTEETEPTGTPLDLWEKRKVGKITFLWKPPECGKRNGVMEYYYYMILNGNVEEDSIESRTVKEIMGLNEGDVYSFKVRAYTKVGEGDYTSELQDVFSV